MADRILTPGDLHHVLTRVPKDVRKLMVHHGLLLGGGFIRETIAGGEAHDIDLFGPGTSLLELAAKSLATDRDGRTFTSENAITVLSPPRVPVQFIKRWLFDDAAKLVESFDFTVCQAVIWFGDGAWRSMTGDGFYADLAARRLVYTFPKREEAAGGSMMRVRKFLARGYNIQATSLAGVIARVAGGVRNIEALDEQQRAFAIAGLLHEVDPLLVVDGMDVVNDHEEVARG